MAADLRANRSGLVTDNFQKVYQIQDNILFGMTGIAEHGLEILTRITSKSHSDIDSLIKFTDDIFLPRPKDLTIMIAGKLENGNFFIWQKNNNGEIIRAPVSSKTIAYSINTANNASLIRSRLELFLQTVRPIEKAIERTIQYASKIDESISPTYKLHKLK